MDFRSKNSTNQIAELSVESLIMVRIINIINTLVRERCVLTGLPFLIFFKFIIIIFVAVVVVS